jgi:hypothetical protein
MTSHD